MSWSQPADLRAQLERRWQRGDLLRASIDPQALPWPLRLSLKTPSTSDLTHRFAAVRNWVDTLSAMPRVQIDWAEKLHRVQGKQRLPAAIWVQCLDDALALLGKTGDAKRFQDLYRHTAQAQPALLPWLDQFPLKALELSAHWPRLLAVVAWMQRHPRPGIYLRQVDAPGIDSKWIETHRHTLAQWFDLALPAEAIEHAATGAGQFARRYGFCDKPVRIRLRLLDATLPNLPGCTGLSDITLDAGSFAALQLPLERVFITENEVNFLAFPPIPRAIAIFGAGYGWDALARARWLHQCQMYYWGDIDSHGFAILDTLRAHFPQVKSFLMDRQTLLAHSLQWGEEPADKRLERPLSRLSAEEAALFDDLRLDRIQLRLRLEQERIGYDWLHTALAHQTA